MSRTKAETSGKRSKASRRDSAALRAENDRLRTEIADLALKNEEMREQLSATVPRQPVKGSIKA
jgi:hypothetical protein